MGLSVIESILYGLVSGITEFLPTSSTAHQTVALRIFGENAHDPLMDLFTHLALLLAVFFAARPLIDKVKRDKKMASRYRAQRRSYTAFLGAYDDRLVRTAAVPMCVGLLLVIFTGKMRNSLVWTAVFSLLNGVILLVFDHLRQSNKDSRQMTVLDSFLIGLSSALSVLPGVSRIGAGVSVSRGLGASADCAWDWAILLSIPALAVSMAGDVILAVIEGVPGFSVSVAFGYLLTFAAAFAGGYLVIRFLRAFLSRSGLGEFAYYSWGVTLLSIALYLLT